MSSNGSYQIIVYQSDSETAPLYSEILRFAHFYSVGGRPNHSAAQIGGKFCKVGIIVRALLIPGSDGMHDGALRWCTMTKSGAPWKSLVLSTNSSGSLWCTFLCNNGSGRRPAILVSWLQFRGGGWCVQIVPHEQLHAKNPSM